MVDIEIRTASHDDMDFITKFSSLGSQRFASHALPTIEGASTAENSPILMAVDGDGRRLGYIQLCPGNDNSAEKPRRYVVRLATAYGTARDVRSSLLAEAEAWCKKRHYWPVSFEVLGEDESGAVFEAGTITLPNPL